MKKLLFWGSILLVIIVFFACRKINGIEAKTDAIGTARSWYENQDRNGFNDIFKTNITIDWDAAKERVFPNNNRVIVVPMLEQTKTHGYLGKRLLYLYPKKKESGFLTRVLEFTPSVKYMILHKGQINNRDFTGFVTAWDLKKGFVKGMRVENALPVASIQLTLINDPNKALLSQESKANSWLPPVTVTSNPVYRGANNFFFSLFTIVNAIMDFSSMSGPGNPCEYTSCNTNNLDALFENTDFQNELIERQRAADSAWLKDQVKDSANNPCITEVKNDLAGNPNASVAGGLRFNSNADPDFLAVIKLNDLGDSVLASTTMPQNYAKNEYAITLNSHFPQTTLGLAASILHELAHSQFLALYNLAVTVGDTASQRFVVETYGYTFTTDDGISNNFAYLQNTQQSDQMIADQYIGPLGAVLYDYAQKKGLTTVTQQNCTDLMWSGLQNTESYKKLDTNTKTRIDNIINIEKTGTNTTGTKKGSPCL